MGTSTPSHDQVIDLLVLQVESSDDESYDFTLPGDVTNYVISVTFGKNGMIKSIEMES